VPINNNVVQRAPATQYDGTNSSEILAASSVGAEIVSEEDDVLVISTTYLGTSTYHVGDWITVSGGKIASEDFEAQFRIIEDAPTTPDQAAGVSSVPSLVGNAQTTVPVTISPAFPNTSYSVAPVITGGVNLLSSLSVLSTSKISGSQVDVVVKNTGLLTLAGASVLVVAVA